MATPVATGPTGDLRCPCGHGMTHLMGGDWGLNPGKRLEATLEFECELGCTFYVAVEQFRGVTTLRSVIHTPGTPA